MLNVIKGKQVVAPKLMLYGLAGSGKSTLAATLPQAVFLDIEGGLSFLDVARVPIASAEELMSALLELGKQVKTGKQEYKYIVIDSVDWAIRLFTKKITGSGNANTLPGLMESAKSTLYSGDNAYGKGKLYLENFVKDVFIEYLERLRRIGYGIVLISHATTQNMMDADGVSSMHITPKMDINSMNALVEWVDSIFYLRTHDDGTRTLQVSATDLVVAKNRMGLPQEEVTVDDKFNLHKLITTANDNKLTKQGDK